MMDLGKLQELSESAKESAAAYQLHRKPVTEVLASSGKEYLGLLGPRGAGKTVALRQIGLQTPGSFYLSVDLLPRDLPLFELIEDITVSYSPKLLLLDEVHFNRNINQALKNAYDFLDLRIIFTSSVALRMHQAAHDLSRRVRLVSVPYFSFLEHVCLSTRNLHEPLGREILIEGALSAEYLANDHLFENYLKGAICPFSRDVSEIKPALENVIARIVDDDIPRVSDVSVDDITDIVRVLKFIGRSAVDGVNPSSVAKNCGVPRSKAEAILTLLEQAFIVQQIWPFPSSNVLREPKVLLHPPFRLLYRDYDDAVGGLREDYAAWALTQAGLPFTYLKSTRGEKCPDFLLKIEDREVVIEVGGRGKGRQQFKGLGRGVKKRILRAEPPYRGDDLPLWVLGCM